MGKALVCAFDASGKNHHAQNCVYALSLAESQTDAG